MISMSRQLLYLFGEPGTGKITVARILQKRLGWKLFWLHDLDKVCAIVDRYPLPRLMDKISLDVLEELMAEGQDLIYVRPSRDVQTREGVRDLADLNSYVTYSICLWASYDTLVDRIESRENGSALRISSKQGLDEYLSTRVPTLVVASEYLVHTENCIAAEVADEILDSIQIRTNDRLNLPWVSQ